VLEQDTQKEVAEWILANDGLFYAALSGFADAEGTVGLNIHKNIHKNARPGRSATPVFQICNKNKMICDDFANGIRRRGFDARCHWNVDTCAVKQWEVTVRGLDALPLLEKLKFRHEEKIEAKILVLANDGSSWDEVGPIYKAFRRRIREGRDLCVLSAERAFAIRHKFKQAKLSRYAEITKSAQALRLEGLKVEEIATALGWSVRTIYRHLEKLREI